jgi:hypothetical protein
MAIVPDRAGVRPGRPGNIPLSDPRNRSSKERALTDDNFGAETRVTLAAGNQVVLAEERTRNSLLFLTPDEADVVYISTTAMSAPSGIPVYPGVGFQIRGKSAEHAYYCYGVSGVILSIFEG